MKSHSKSYKNQPIPSLPSFPTPFCPHSTSIQVPSSQFSHQELRYCHELQCAETLLNNRRWNICEGRLHPVCAATLNVPQSMLANC